MSRMRGIVIRTFVTAAAAVTLALGAAQLSAGTALAADHARGHDDGGLTTCPMRPAKEDEQNGSQAHRGRDGWF